MRAGPPAVGPKAYNRWQPETARHGREKEAALGARVMDPLRFAEHLLGRRLWRMQKDILRSTAEHQRTVVKKCHASGGTFIAAVATLWWVTRWPKGKVITTAPTWTQVERLIWGEIHRLAAESLVQYPPALKTELRLGADRYAMGLSTDQGVRFQGFHGDVLVVVDEAPGVSDEIYDAIDGIMAGGRVHLLAMGQPVTGGGAFYDAFHRDRGLWSRFTISAFDTPNFRAANRTPITLEQLLTFTDQQLDTNAAPYLITRRWVKEAFDRWGTSHPWWEARVLGEFPTKAENVLVPAAWVDVALAKPAEDDGGPITVGLDPAGGGRDTTSGAMMCGGSILSMLRSHKEDARGEVMRWLEPRRHRIAWVRIDPVGVGWYLGKHLREQGYTVREAHPQASTSDPQRFHVLKDELAWRLREGFERREISGLDEQAGEQFTTMRWVLDSRGRTTMEPKKARKKRGLRSPDDAEALILAYAGRKQGEGSGLFEIGWDAAEAKEGATPLAGLRAKRW